MMTTQTTRYIVTYVRTDYPLAPWRETVRYAASADEARQQFTRPGIRIVGVRADGVSDEDMRSFAS